MAPRPALMKRLADTDGLAYGGSPVSEETAATMPARRPVPANLDAFLRDVGRRAHIIAELAVRDREAAMDIVQEAMLSLVANYRDREPAAWAPLFHVILQSKIMDHHRREARRKRWFGFLGPANPDPDDDSDAMADVPELRSSDPARLLETAEDMDTVLAAVEALPLRQQQAFLLRAWEGLDTAQTAAAMDCSDGSVKTHYFRALAAIRQRLENHPGTAATRATEATP